MGGAIRAWLLRAGASRQHRASVAASVDLWEQDAPSDAVTRTTTWPRGPHTDAWVRGDDHWFASTDAVSRAWALALTHHAINRRTNLAGGTLLLATVTGVIAVTQGAGMILQWLGDGAEPVPSTSVSLLGILLSVTGILFSVGSMMLRGAVALAQRQGSRMRRWRRDGTAR